MITRLFIDNFYAHQNVEFHFETGLTGIIGPNESGKSLIQEAIRYALFGTAALRSTAPANLHVELEFVVNGVTHQVVRKGRNARLDDQAVGTKPVNAAIIKILGYDLQVFDVANSCNQGSVEALSNMQPAQRKAMVDRTVGLDTLDAVIKHCGERGNALKSQAMGIKATMEDPGEAPVAPEGYQPSAVLKPLVGEAMEDTRELAQIVGFLSGGPVPPAVECPTLSTGELQDAIELARDGVQELNQIEGFLSRAPEAPVAPVLVSFDCDLQALEAQRIEASEHNAQNARQRARISPEQFSEAELDAVEAQYAQWGLWTDRVNLLAKGHHCCPACNHSWPIAEGIPDAVETAQSTMSRVELKRQRSLLGNNALLAQLVDLPVGEPRTDDLRALNAYEAGMRAYEAARGAFDAYNEDLPAKLARGEALANVRETVASLTKELSNAQLWAAFNAFEAKAAVQRVRALALEGAGARYTYLQAQLTTAGAYEFQVACHLKLQEVYAWNLEIYETTVASSEVYFQARLDIVALKGRVKSYLLPSLNRVASSLLNEMTGGARYSIEINEEFDILVDGGAINTLSGSGKAVANLAIRLALGRILTNRVFSLFMADEVDGSMDLERADYVAQALGRLTGTVQQVILITHKRPDTDHTIELKK